MDTAVDEVLEEEKVKATMVGVFGMGTSNDSSHDQPRGFALVVTVVEDSTTVEQAVKITEKLCLVLARFDVFAKRIYVQFFLTCASALTSSIRCASKCRKAMWHV